MLGTGSVAILCRTLGECMECRMFFSVLFDSELFQVVIPQLEMTEAYNYKINTISTVSLQPF